MNTLKDKPFNEFKIKAPIWFVLAIAAVPVWLAINAFTRTVGVHEDEAVSTAATMCFFTGIFLGRYFAILWSVRDNKITDSLLIALSFVIGISTIWLFYHAEYPFENRGALNLLMYWLPFMLISLTLGALIKLGRAAGEKRLKEAQTSAAHSQSELHLLQSQLSPHFLFNTLNNLYGLSLTQHEKIPPLLLKLSDLLRYSVYDSGETFVPLKDELAYIDNYIEFEKIRIGDRLELTTDIEKKSEASIKIAPMLLIVFIENAFKHSKNTAEDRIYIEYSLKIWGNSILFYIKNSHSKSTEESVVIPKSSGLGLANVKKRLDLLYPNQHELNIDNEETSYTINLRLKMK